jgi:glycosyltransferase involved in cell wall biosynthesis
MVVTNDAVSDPRVEKEGTALVAAGFEVIVLAWDRSGEAPAVEERLGLRIERLGPRAPYGGGLRSLLLFRSFWAGASARAHELVPAIVHCHDLDTAVVGLRVLRSRPATKLVVDHHELYRETRMVPQHGLVGVLARGLVDALDRRAARAASLVVVSVPSFEARYERWAPGRVVVVENAPDAGLFRPRTTPRPDRPFTVGYVGQKRYAASLMMLMAIVQRHDDLAALLAGGGTAAEEVDRIGEKMTRVEVAGRFVYADLPAYYERCDAVFGVYDADVGNIRAAFPVKVMEGMACGLPVVVNAGTWIGDYVTRHGIGIAVDGSDAAAVEAALVRLKDKPAEAAAMGASGRALVESGLSWGIVSERLVAAYQKLRRAR